MYYFNVNLRKTEFCADTEIFHGIWLEVMDFISVLDIDIRVSVFRQLSRLLS